ncbi:MAG: hypothetical protein ACFFD1_15130 [Candidatus Thorarchaeota archaeon]
MARDLHFYTELITVSILSLLASSMWIRWIKQYLDRHFPNNVTIDFFVSLLLTFFAIYILNTAFSTEEDLEKKEDPDKLLSSIYRKIKEYRK